MPLYGFSKKDVRRIARSVRRTEGVARRLGSRRRVDRRRGGRGGGGSVGEAIVRGYISEDLDPSTNCGANPTTASLTVWSAEGGSWAATSRTETLTNRDDSLFISSGSYIVAAPDGDEWVVVEFGFANCGKVGVACNCDQCVEAWNASFPNVAKYFRVSISGVTGGACCESFNRTWCTVETNCGFVPCEWIDTKNDESPCSATGLVMQVNIVQADAYGGTVDEFVWVVKFSGNAIADSVYVSDPFLKTNGDCVPQGGITVYKDSGFACLPSSLVLEATDDLTGCTA